MGEVIVEQLKGERLMHFWPAIAAELDQLQFLWADYWTKDVLLNGADCGRFQIWAAGKDMSASVILLSQIIVYPASTVFQVFLAFGNRLEEMLPMIVATLEQFARRNGCSSVEIVGRKGWERKLRADGYRLDTVCVKRSLRSMEIH